MNGTINYYIICKLYKLKTSRTQKKKKRVIPLNQMPIRQHYFLCFIKYIVIILLIKKESINEIHVEVLLSIEKEKKKTFEVIIL